MRDKMEIEVACQLPGSVNVLRLLPLTYLIAQAVGLHHGLADNPYTRDMLKCNCNGTELPMLAVKMVISALKILHSR